MKSDDRRQHIIERSIKIFAERGLHGTRTRHLAKVSGVNEALLYRHFDSKEDLFLNAMNFIHSCARESCDRIVENASNSLEAVREITQTQTSLAYESNSVGLNAIHGFSASAANDEMREIFSGWFSEANQFIENLLKSAKEEGCVKPDVDPRSTALWIRSFIWFTCIHAALGLQYQLPADESRKLLDDFINSLSTTG